MPDLIPPSRPRPDESREPYQRLGPGFRREPWIPAFALTPMRCRAFAGMTIYDCWNAFLIPALIAFVLDLAGPSRGPALGTFSAITDLGVGLGAVVTGVHPSLGQLSDDVPLFGIHWNRQLPLFHFFCEEKEGLTVKPPHLTGPHSRIYIIAVDR